MLDLHYETLHTKFQTDWCCGGPVMGPAKCHFWLKTGKSYYCILARAVGGRGMVTFALASAVITLLFFSNPFLLVLGCLRFRRFASSVPDKLSLLRIHCSSWASLQIV